ncbi:serine carboxypeptidase-like 12 isoform X2 [Lathyrus oleraceus]|uniref:serine carboxypeptidase-like 12 isoform X2 n=1 Tax=Pisum sativum TaxID=3888 RepID=UPI0021D1EE03|nr:serine carboxypeptidase-like 12 isoform X2 [Pisum sativum]
MAKSNTSLLHLLLLLLSNISFQVATCGSIVKFLPGFNGPLPFVLETGYVGVGEKEDVQVFYYFIESENNPKEDPLMLWLTGGPGCSALSGLVFEIGPLEFRKEEYNGSLPNLILKPHSWTKVSSIIFVDLPVYTGFTYATTNSGSDRSDSLLVDQAHQFLKKGYLLGNAVTTEKEKNYAIPFAHGMGLISDELYNSLQINCNGEYINVETTNVLCSRDIKSYDKCTSGLNKAHILDPLCEWRDDTEFFLRRSLIKKYPSNFLSTNLRLPPLYCRSYPYFLCGFWANDDNVRKALHIRKGSIQKWHRCSYNIPHKRDIFNSYDYHVNLSRKGIRSLIYSGDHDMSVPFLATQAWIRSLNYSIVDDWRQWHTDDQVAGYTRTYSNQMTFATVKGGGHTAPEFRPKECFDMFSRWISKRDL